MSQCVICFSTAVSPFTTKCNHTFCNKCLIQWMLENDSCPMCRNIISYNDKSSANQQIEMEIEDPTFTVYLGIMFNKNYRSILEKCVDDFIEAYRNEEHYYPRFKWKETKEGYYDVRVKQKNTYITFRFEIFKSVSRQEKFVINVFTTTKYIKKFNDIKHLNKPKTINYRSKIYCR